MDTASELQREKGNRHSAPFTLTTTEPALKLWRNLHATSPSHQQMRVGPTASHKSCRRYTGTLPLKESGNILNCQQGGQVRQPGPTQAAALLRSSQGISKSPMDAVGQSAAWPGRGSSPRGCQMPRESAPQHPPSPSNWPSVKPRRSGVSSSDCMVPKQSPPVADAVTDGGELGDCLYPGFWTNSCKALEHSQCSSTAAPVAFRWTVCIMAHPAGLVPPLANREEKPLSVAGAELHCPYSHPTLSPRWILPNGQSKETIQKPTSRETGAAHIPKRTQAQERRKSAAPLLQGHSLMGQAGRGGGLCTCESETLRLTDPPVLLVGKALLLIWPKTFGRKHSTETSLCTEAGGQARGHDTACSPGWLSAWSQ